VYFTTGGQSDFASEATVAHALSQSFAISGAAAGGIKHLALDFMDILRC
jgi:hypothetical protein